VHVVCFYQSHICFFVYIFVLGSSIPTAISRHYYKKNLVLLMHVIKIVSVAIFWGNLNLVVVRFCSCFCCLYNTLFCWTWFEISVDIYFWCRFCYFVNVFVSLCSTLLKLLLFPYFCVWFYILFWFEMDRYERHVLLIKLYYL